MRIEIEINEAEAAGLRAFAAEVELNQRGVALQELRNIMVVRLAAALPRPIQVGDKVVYASAFDSPLEAAVWNVLAIHGEHAWIRWVSGDGPITKPLSELVRVDSESENP